jgi:acetylornithine deacetylase/succinyl-diaminopimelate desuccinylase-like protein
MSEAQEGSTSINWEGALWECIGHLQTLIRMDTVNPPGNEIGLARYLDDVLRGAGITTTLLEPAQGRAALVGRIPGNGQARPLLMLAHMDVVGVDRAQWRTNPFGGELLDGCLYGRGAIDDKGMLAVNLQTMLLVQEHVIRAGAGLTRDLVFVATSDEEAGGTYGIDWIIENHPDLLDAEYALNEGGRIHSEGERPVYCAVQCAEKVSNTLRVTARGAAGHASVPHGDNAVVRLGRALARIGSHAEPVQLSDVTREFFRGLSRVWPDERERAAMADLGSGSLRRARAGARIIAAMPHLDALIRNGISPTMMSAGIRANVIPSEAHAIMSVRLLPDESLETLIERLRAAVEDDRVDIDVENRGSGAPGSPLDSPMFTAIRESISQLAPGVPTFPFLSAGATDSAALRAMGIKAYGLLPFPLTQEDENRMHGHDERVPVSSLAFGVRLTWEIVRRMTA